jgi:pimeloyl-ACP methyl ester carboxylesterase
MRRLRHLFAWLGGIAFIALAVLVAGAFTVRTTLVPRLEREIFATRSPTTATPETFGVPYRALKLAGHGRTLDAWTVDAGPGTPALLLFHGNGETIHDFAQVQAYLYRQHVSSMSFDYAGFGASTGVPTIEHLDQDAHTAWRAFAAWTGGAHPRFVVGYSLGTAVALQNVSTFAPRPLAVAVYGAFGSARNLVAYIDPALPQWLGYVVPDVWDNVAAAAKLRAPLLVVAGMNDVNVPPDMSRQIALFAHAGGEYLLIPNAGHGGIQTRMDAVWPPILAFFRQQVAPHASAADVQPAPATTLPMPASVATVGG